MKKEKYIIQIAPVTPLPAARTQIFSYLHDSLLPDGTLVDIPFYFRQIRGIVTGGKKDFPRQGAMKLKNIKDVVQLSFLTRKQIELARYIAEYYLSPLGIVMKSMIPERRKGRDQKAVSAKKKKAAVFINREAKKILASQAKKFLLEGSSEKRNEVVSGLIGGMIKKGKQCLVLIPEIYFFHGILREVEEKFPGEEIAVMHSYAAKGKFYDAWEKIKEGKIKIVIASKVGVFLPFADLGLVVVKDEQNLSHKQWDMTPRFGAVKVAEHLALIFGAKMVFDSSFYSLETWSRSEKKEIEAVKIGKKEEKNVRIEIVDLLSERKKPDFPISRFLYKELAGIVEKKEKAMVLVGRRGSSTFSVCSGCQKILRCPECEKALVYFEQYEEYRCLHCSFRSNLLSSCPTCGGSQFSHFGAGTEAVEKKLKKMFPSVKVGRLDSNISRSAKKHEKIHREFSEKKMNILVGTKIVLGDADFGKAEVVGIISAHDFSGIPDFNVRENALANFAKAQEMVSEKGCFIIQTFSPNDDLLKFVTSGKYEEHYEYEAKMRKKFSYPPFSKLIKLVFRDKSKEKAEKEAKRIFDLLQAVGDNKVDISDPYDPLVSRRGTWRLKSILIRFGPERELKNLPVYPVLTNLRKGWSIDVDPISTI